MTPSDKLCSEYKSGTILIKTLFLKMKCRLVLLLAGLALAQAEFTWKWSELILLEPIALPGSLKHVPLKNAGRIVGGVEAVPHSYPFQAGIFIYLDKGVGFCGGSVLTEQYILTAAHCVYEANEAEIIVGAHKIEEVEPTQQRIFTSDFIVHEKWSGETLQNNIALVKLPTLLEFNEFVKPVRLPRFSDAGEHIEGALADISGWGRPSDSTNSISPVLRHVETKVLSKSLCELAFFFVTGDNHICTSGKNGKGSCRGDSGGPLTVLDNEGHTLQGIVSFRYTSFGCENGWPSAFTRVGGFLSWIEQNSDIIIEN